jgi:hypothetical protein
LSENNFEKYQREHTGITWKEYVDLRFEEQDKALHLSRNEMNRRLEGMNEIRSQLDRQAATFLTREAFEANDEKLLARIMSLENSLSAEVARNKVYVIL